jgi:hypothetical protein
LREPSVAAHFGDTPLERTVFVIGTGPGLGNARRARVIDVNPTVLHQLGVRVDPAWNLDGRSLSRSAVASAASASVRGGRLFARLKLGAGPRRSLCELPPAARPAREHRVPAGQRRSPSAGSACSAAGGPSRPA